jgi:hypothetical protein
MRTHPAMRSARSRAPRPGALSTSVTSSWSLSREKPHLSLKRNTFCSEWNRTALPRSVTLTASFCAESRTESGPQNTSTCTHAHNKAGDEEHVKTKVQYSKLWLLVQCLPERHRQTRQHTASPLSIHGAHNRRAARHTKGVWQARVCRLSQWPVPSPERKGSQQLSAPPHEVSSTHTKWHTRHTSHEMALPASNPPVPAHAFHGVTSISTSFVKRAYPYTPSASPPAIA